MHLYCYVDIYLPPMHMVGTSVVTGLQAATIATPSSPDENATSESSNGK